MATAVKTFCPQLSQVRSETKTVSVAFRFDEALAPISVTGPTAEFRKSSPFLPIIVLIPKSAVRDHTMPQITLMNDFGMQLAAAPASAIPLEVASTWFDGPDPSALFAFGDVTVSFSAMEARRKGQAVTLALKEFKTLAYMIQNAGRVISRDELLNEVWGYECYPCTRTVDNHILKLRQKLEADPSRPRHFLTVHSAGYKFAP